MNSGETLYVYDGSTGQVQYTVDNAAPEQIQHFKETNVSFYVGPSNGKIIGTYIKKDDDTGIPLISKIFPKCSTYEYQTEEDVEKTTINEIYFPNYIVTRNEGGKTTFKRRKLM